MSGIWEGGKGDRQRPVNQEKWGSAWKISVNLLGTSSEMVSVFIVEN